MTAATPADPRRSVSGGEPPAGPSFETFAGSITAGLEIVADLTRPAEERAAFYAILHRIQGTIRKGLGIGVRSGATPQAELIAHMERNGLRRMGPLSIRATAIDPSWPVNGPDNWGDYGLQDQLAQFAKMAPAYIRKVPEHFEVDYLALTADMTEGVEVARELYKHANAAGWRLEEGRRLSLEVRKGQAA